MNETREERFPEDGTVVNPFDSPAVDENDSAETSRSADNFPSLTMLGTCVLLGILLQLIARHEKLLLAYNSLPNLLVWSVPALVLGTVSGLGMALLLTSSLARGKFAALMPGHWLLIAFIPQALVSIATNLYLSEPELGGFSRDEMLITTGEDLYWYVRPQEMLSLVSAKILVVFYLAVLIYSSEPSRWKVLAGVNLFFWLITIIQLVCGFFVWNELDVSPTFSGVTTSLIAVCNLTAFFAIVISVILDYRQRVLRDLFHWVGIVQLVAVPMLAIATSFLR